MSELSDLQAISGRLERGEINSAQYLAELLRFVAAQIGCSRAGLRLFVDTGGARVLRCVVRDLCRYRPKTSAPEPS